MKFQLISSSLGVFIPWMKNGTKAFVGIFMFFNDYQSKKGNQRKS
jgi:hypothetical protein